ncbi:hypothetical protein ACHAW5_009357 [Stephanodiscus triporus]|uniref:peptidylprolyl isomerase n=1 Tax=Stephanodiscus triporus TaxID=2934178 RepID=A0ABD3N861_9STRA
MNTTDAAAEEEIASRDVSIPPPNAFDDVPPISEEDSASAASATDVDDDTDDDGAVKRNNGGSDDEDDDDPPPDPTDALLSAMSHKESGNEHFKSGKYADAARSYRRGTNVLKNFNHDNAGDEQVKSILITLQTNLSMVTYKQEKYRVSRDVASKVLDIDPNNVKALYRRAVAHRSMGDLDSAKDDLRAALGAEPNNAAVRKELASVRKVLDERRAKEKRGLQRAFSSRAGSSLLYSDREEEERRKEDERREKERLEREATEGRKKEWEEECVKRMASDPPQDVVSFEEWEKQRRKKEEKAEKARKKAKKAEEERRREERRKARAGAANDGNDPDDDSEDELTEKELAALRGYKKTSDGRTTSYFTREQTERERELIGSIAPRRLDGSSSSSSSNPTPAAAAAALDPSSSSGGGGVTGSGPSAWNASGTTWEEKDATDWCTKTLERCLLDAPPSSYFSESSSTAYVASVKGVSDVKGDASVAIAGGKKRYIYDYHATVDYEISDGGGEVVASGSLRLPEVHSANTSSGNVEEELEVEVLAWKRAPSSPSRNDDIGASITAQDCVECRRVLITDVRKSVLGFVEKFNANF